jgi:hypothetical protein
LSVAPTADADTIKKAFRREIARYHPDKVIHLGPEFQEMAATRAAELTVAYKTLSDPAMREQYDAGVIGAEPIPAVEPTPPAREVADEPSTPVRESDSADVQAPADSRRRFEAERADRDHILRRAIAGRVRAAVEAAFGAVEMPVVRGFDTALVPLAKPRFLGSHPPRVLVRAVEVVDAAAIADAWNAAARTKVHVGKSPVVVLLVGRQLARPRDLDQALEAASRQRKPDDGPAELVVVVINASDWKCHPPAEMPSAVRKLIDQICK